MSNDIVCSVVVPLYNEEEVILETYKRLKGVMDSINEPYEIIFVNDGSRDKTAPMVYELCSKDKTVKFVDFARNFGHQTAITAGMDYSEGQAVVVIDADLQDPPELIPKMIEKWREGYDVVYGKRKERKGETLFKKFTAKVFYRFLRSMTDVDIPVDTGDFRLIDRKVCEALKLVNERNRYIRGIISWLGFKQTGIEFVRDKRFAGTTKYPLKKMMKFAFDAITSFSYKPLKFASVFGMLLSSISFIYLIVVICTRIFTSHVQPGWASILAVNLFFHGITLIILGIVGEYIGRIYDEAKGRPLYIVRQTKNFSDDKQNKITGRM
ncbi:MAG TPA: glycosyltransferase family 2 protein [Acetivibrio sp.]|nr:glycosyltransferase family 2 protein [Acetivibrio sp.]